MDKKSILGLVIIGIIFFAYTFYNSKQQTELNKQNALRDSIELAQSINDLNNRLGEPARQPNDTSFAAGNQEAALEQHLGSSLYNATKGSEQFYTIENDVMKLVLSNKGGRVATVELKDYKTYKKTPLILFPAETSKFDLSFFITNGYNDKEIRTADYFFTPDQTGNVTFGDADEAKTFVLRLNVDSLAYVEYLYTVYKDNYMIDFDIRFVGMEKYLSANQRELNLLWRNDSFQNERGFANENNATTLAFRFPGEKSIEDLGFSKDDKSEKISSKIHWVAFKQQFFTSAIIARDNFQNGMLSYTTFPPTDIKMKSFSAELTLPFTPQTSEYKMNFYFGPNRFSTLRQYDIRLERLVPLGSWVIGWINRLIVIPTFDILGRFISSYGIIILIMTILIKILIAPLTYKSYLSSAKMRLLKPDIDKLAEKYPKKEDALKKQQATMELYRKAGVNPMGGCIPLLIQFPILIAMFRFFPASIELRQQSFLWANDLSSYDSILTLPFEIPFYGSHVSLFALLMALSVYFSSRINYAQTAASGQQMAGMKFMMLYMMPIMLLVWFNNSSSGLSYYYLLSNIITIGQTYVFRYAVSDEKLHKKMKENSAKPPKKKSKWQQRYDELMKAQQQQQQQQKQVAKPHPKKKK